MMSIGMFLRQMLTSLRPYWARSAVLLIGLLLETGFTSGLAIGFKVLLDQAIVPGNHQILAWVLGLLAGGAAVAALVGLGNDYLYVQVRTALLRDLRCQLFRHLQRLSLGFYVRTEAGHILARFSTDLAAVDNALTAAIPWALLPGLQVLFSTVLLFTLEWRLALVAMLVFPLTLVGPKRFAPRASVASYALKQHEASLLATVQEYLSTQVAVQAFGLQPQRGTHFARQLDDLVKSSLGVGFYSALVERSAGISILLLQVLVMGVRASMAFHQQLSIGALVSFQSLFLTLSWSLSYVTQYVPSLVQGAGGMQRIAELLSEQPHVVDAPDALPLPRFTQTITFEDVQFSYDGAHMNLAGVSFAIREGESVAFVGASGSGKSTILNLLTRFYDPTAGRVTMDGWDLRHVTRHRPGPDGPGRAGECPVSHHDS